MKCVNIHCSNDLTEYEIKRQSGLTVRYFVCRRCRQRLGQGDILILKCISCDAKLNLMQQKVAPRCHACMKHKVTEYIKKYKRERYIPRERKLKTYCLRGHEYAVVGKYRRSCKQCIIERSKNNYIPTRKKTHCVHGHEYAITGRYGHRCAECVRVYMREKYRNMRSVLI